MSTGHFVTDRQLSLCRHIHLDHLDHTWRQVVTLSHPVNDAIISLGNQPGLFFIALKDRINLFYRILLFLKNRYPGDYAKPDQFKAMSAAIFFPSLTMTSPFLSDDITLWPFGLQ